MLGNGGTAVLFDMDHSAGTYAVADALAQHYDQPGLLTPRTQIAKSVNYCSAIGVHRRLYEADVEIVLAAELVDLRDGRLTWRNVFTGRVARDHRCEASGMVDAADRRRRARAPAAAGRT